MIFPLALSASLLLATVDATAYWKFCTNDDFTDCGTSVSETNSGCLKESGRKSLATAGGTPDFHNALLIAYRDDNCQQEKGCNSLADNGGGESSVSFEEAQFKFALGALSFKFDDSGSSCPNGCVGVCNNAKRSRIMAADYEPSPNVTQRDADARASGKFHFCDDEACSVNCGPDMSVNPSLGSATCARDEGGRHSVFFSDLGSTLARIGGYDNGDCEGSPVSQAQSGNGCFALPQSEASWDVIGISAN